MLVESLVGLQVLRRGRFSPEALRRYQEKRLRLLLRHACNNVPFYQRHFRTAGVHLDEIQGLSDLAKLPLVTKADLREALPGELLARGIEPSRCLTVPTSGSSGEPLAVVLTRRERIIRSMVEFRGLRRIGLRPSDRLVILGPTIQPSPLISRRLGVFRLRHIQPQAKVEDQVAELERLKPTVFWAYPGHLRSLLIHLEGRLSSIIRPRFVITSAEVCEQELRSQIEQDLGVETFDFYAAVETGRIAVECPLHRGLHINADSVIVEIVRGERVSALGEEGTVVITSLDGFAMPIIRYELGDLSKLVAGDCGCGSAFPRMQAPSGRKGCLIVLPSGRTLAFLRLNICLKTRFWIRQFLVVQETAHHLTILVRPLRKPSRVEWEAVQSAVAECLGEPLRLDFELVERLPSWQPKFSSFCSKLEQ